VHADHSIGVIFTAFRQPEWQAHANGITAEHPHILDKTIAGVSRAWMNTVRKMNHIPELSATRDGSFEVTNSRTNYTQKYAAAH